MGKNGKVCMRSIRISFPATVGTNFSGANRKTGEHSLLSAPEPRTPLILPVPLRKHEDSFQVSWGLHPGRHRLDVAPSVKTASPFPSAFNEILQWIAPASRNPRAAVHARTMMGSKASWHDSSSDSGLSMLAHQGFAVLRISFQRWGYLSIFFCTCQ